jgi:hypothetical protein
VVAIPHIAEIPADGAFVIRSLADWTLDTLWVAAQVS